MNQFDQYHDAGFGRLRHLLEEHPVIADRLKTAEIDDDVNSLPPSAFAWPSERLFPIHTSEQAAISYLYAKTASVPNEVMEEIKTALEAFDVYCESDFSPVVVKEAAIAGEDCLFPETQTYPVRSPEEVKLAEARLLSQVGKMQPETRAEIFTRLAKFAHQYKHTLHPLSAKFAGLTETDPHTLRTALLGRSGATKNAELAAKYVALSDAVAQDPRALRDRLTQIKLAEAIGTLDEQEPLIMKSYDRRLPDPILSVFNTEKRSDERSVDCGCGQPVALSKLAALGPGFYADALGDDILPEIAPGGQLDGERLAHIIPTLPRDMKRVLCQALRSAGHS